MGLKKTSGKRRLILCMHENVTKIPVTFYVNLENNRKIPSSVFFFLYNQFVVAYHPKI